jgi:CheY-like chemotaxis protein
MNPARPSLQILLVEDHASTNEVLVRMLARAGHACTAVSDAAAAVEVFLKARFDVVISDIGLPGTNGWELLKLLRAVRSDFRAIALTGYCFPGDHEQSHEVGFDLHIAKPPEWGTIENALASLMRSGEAMASEQTSPK